jgi:hypothetical protein
MHSSSVHNPITNYFIDYGMTLYISNIENNYAKYNYIKRVFSELNIGEIKEITFINGTVKNCKDGIIYMDKWCNNIIVENLQNKILDINEHAKIVYDDPKFWILQKYERFKPVSAETAITMQYHVKSLERKIIDLERKVYYYETNSYNKRSISHLYTRNACCGAASNAWVPSYPSYNE